MCNISASYEDFIMSAPQLLLLGERESEREREQSNKKRREKKDPELKYLFLVAVVIFQEELSLFVKAVRSICNMVCIRQATPADLILMQTSNLWCLPEK
jgi:hypothetical protein